MVFKLGKDGEIKLFVTALYFLIFYFFYLLPLPLPRAGWTRIGFVSVVLCFLLFLPGMIYVLKKYKFLSFEIGYIFLVIAMVCVFSMISYDENIMDMIICTGSYLFILMAPILLVMFHLVGFHESVHYILMVETFYDFVLLICAFVKNNLGIMPLKVATISSKTSNVRAAAGALCPFATVYFVYLLISKRDKLKTIVALAINLATQFYVEQTRMKEIAILVASVAIVVFFMKAVKNQNWPIVLTIIGIILFFYLGYYEEMMNSFSADPKLNPHYTSTVARLRAVEYFKTYTEKNIFFGLGFINPRTNHLNDIFSGPSHTCFLDDLGITGCFFRNGLLGLSYYIMVLARMAYAFFKIHDKHYKSIMLGIAVFTMISSSSLSIFDGQRIVMVPFIMAVTEFLLNDTPKTEKES